MAFYRMLDEGAQERLEDKLQHFIVTKTWRAHGGPLTEEMQVVVAAVACRLTLNLPWELYGSVRYVNLRYDRAWDDVVGLGSRSMVMLSWPTLLSHLDNPADGDNVGYHEFAHALDAADGAADGVPPGPPGTIALDWVHVIAAARAEVARAAAPPLDRYAAKDDAELFAVATERFFSQPHALAEAMPALYRVLRDFYRQDPVQDCDAP